MVQVSMTVNGRSVSADVDPRTLLVHFLRDTLRLTGTHVGCDTSQCGACVVHLDGEAVKSCTALAVSCEGASVTTIEGLAQGGALHPMQQAFQDNHGLQCGFCTPGMIARSDRSCPSSTGGSSFCLRLLTQGEVDGCGQDRHTEHEATGELAVLPWAQRARVAHDRPKGRQREQEPQDDQAYRAAADDRLAGSERRFTGLAHDRSKSWPVTAQ